MKKLKTLTKKQELLAVQTRDEWINLFFDNVKEGRGIDKAAFENGIEWLYKTLLKREKPEIVYCDSHMSFLAMMEILTENLENPSILNKDILSPSLEETLKSCFLEAIRFQIEKPFKLFISQSVVDDVSNSVKSLILNSSIAETVTTAITSRIFCLIKHSLKDEIMEVIGRDVWDVLGNVLDSSIDDTVIEYIGNLISKPLDISICNNVYIPVINSIFDAVNHSFYEPKRTLFNDIMKNSSRYCDLSDFMWVPPYDFFNRSGIAKSDVCEKYAGIVKCCAFATFMYENCVFAVQPPVHLSRNASGRLHSTEGPAVRFRDGSSYYFINGHNVPAYIFERKDTLTREEFLSTRNAELRAAMYGVQGHKKMMEILGAETVNTSEIQHANGDIETVELLKTRDVFPEIGHEPFAWVRLTCPSTGKNYLLGVDPKHTNAAEAVASLSMFNEKGYSFDFRS
jgi:hypothetical protein